MSYLPMEDLFMCMQNTWDDRGQGTLTVRQQEEDGAGPLTQVVFTMESGRILINSAVYKGIKPQLVSPCCSSSCKGGQYGFACVSHLCMLPWPKQGLLCALHQAAVCMLPIIIAFINVSSRLKKFLYVCAGEEAIDGYG